MQCQIFKVEHQNPAKLFQPIPIPELKWETIIMDFITRIPKTSREHDSIMVVVKKLTKSSHFIPINSIYKSSNIEDIFRKEIFRLHKIPRIVAPDRESKFIGNFQKGFFEDLGTQISFKPTCHLETDRTNVIIKDILRIYVMDMPKKWENAYIWLKLHTITSISHL